MRIIRDFHIDSGPLESPLTLTLGNFDGVHLGHKKIIEELKIEAKGHGFPSTLLTLDPHPLNVLKPGLPPFMLTRLDQKIELIEETGIDIMLVMKFDARLAAMTAEEFVKNILVGKLNVRHLVIGHDFNFGKDRTGNAEYLAKVAAEYGFGFSQVPPFSNSDTIFSSSKIREFLRAGNVERAADILGHDFEIRGVVVEGAKQGRELSFPTANIDLGDYIRPQFGVYETEVELASGKTYKSIANIGIKPTLGALKESLEVHILGFAENIYGQEIKIRLKRFIRAEKKFRGLAELKSQIQKDIEEIS